MMILETILIGLSLTAWLAGALLGLQAHALSLLYLINRKKVSVDPPAPGSWPAVTVQLPIYNERWVVEQLIDTACALDYPRTLLTIQVLDDSTDETTLLAHRRVAFHQARGINITMLHRSHRQGFKAGALAHGLQSARGELIAIFDADFLPPSDFLQKLVPRLVSDPGLGMVQARWGFLNARQNLLTRGQTLTLDSHFVVIQTARSRSGLLLNFNGTGGIWRREAIETSGGWYADTLAEDLDLSYRAQIKGWRLAYVPEVEVPSQIPFEIAAYKQQQYRWARGGIQVLRKLGGELWRAPLSWPQRVGGYIHLGSYLAHPILLAFLFCIPFLLILDVHPPYLPWLSIAGAGAPLLIILSQITAYSDWKHRLIYAPVQIALSLGLLLNNSLAVAGAFTDRPTVFLRTPKVPLDAGLQAPHQQGYRLPVDWTVWGEFAMAVYTTALIPFANGRIPALIPVLALCAASFAYVSLTGLLERRPARGESESSQVLAK